jgi:hypothetical protein
MSSTSLHLASSALAHSTLPSVSRSDERPRAISRAPTFSQITSTASKHISTTYEYPKYSSNQCPDDEPYAGLSKKRKQCMVDDEYNGTNIQPRKKRKMNPKIPEPPKRQHRNGTARVSFATEVQVCVENDVDALRKEASKQAILIHTSLSHETPSSILRTALSFNDTVMANHGYHSQNSLHLPYTTIPTKREDGGRHKNIYGRSRMNYHPGRWVSSPDSTRYDTIGHRYRKDRGHSYWVLNVERLQAEARKWDALDAKRDHKLHKLHMAAQIVRPEQLQKEL